VERGASTVLDGEAAAAPRAGRVTCAATSGRVTVY
jgi:hypothetical protein